MQPTVYQTVMNIGIDLPIHFSLPTSIVGKICKESLKMAGVVLFAVLATLLMGL